MSNSITLKAASDIINNLNWRYATKQFDATKKIDDEIWQKIEQSLILNPSSYGLQPWKFIVVKNENIRKNLVAVSRNQSQIVDASHLVVFTFKNKMDEEYIEKWLQEISTQRGISIKHLEGYRKMMIDDLIVGEKSKIINHWACRQAYIALGSVMTICAGLKIDTCAIEGMDEKEYDKILKISPDYNSVCACAFGYRSVDDKYQGIKKVRFDKDEIIEYR